MERERESLSRFGIEKIVVFWNFLIGGSMRLDKLRQVGELGNAVFGYLWFGNVGIGEKAGWVG